MRFPPIITPPRRVIGSLKESLQDYYFLLYDLHIYNTLDDSKIDVAIIKQSYTLCQALYPIIFL